MAAKAMRFFFALLTFVTVGMIIGALVQLSFIRRLEDSYGAKSSLTRVESLRGGLRLTRGNSYWDDKEAATLRLGYVKPEIVSWSPRIIVFHNFLSPEECDYLRAIASPRLEFSTVVDTRTGKGIKSKARTSSGMFLSTEERKYPMIQAIEKRISVYSQVPVENGERIQVLRYEKDQLYRPHHDFFSDTFNLKYGGQRVATMLMYLSDNVEGGETYFPKAGTDKCSCGGKMVTGLCVKPLKGDAVLFWSMVSYLPCTYPQIIITVYSLTPPVFKLEVDSETEGGDNATRLSILVVSGKIRIYKSKGVLNKLDIGAEQQIIKSVLGS